ncbi:MAG: M28 family peptidase [Candidatus Thermoplasmatota archaeon]|nr:M28 family peptidase [Candidatus Thermoplasmatota archaeon]
MGLDTRYHYWEINNKYGKNIEATINGYDNPNNEDYIICAHYDSVKDSPGADDDGSGVAVVMAAAKLISSNYICKNTVKFVAFSGEEQGLLGSYSYVQDALNNNTNISGVLNVDMIGYSETEEDTKYLNLYQDTNNPFEWLTNYTINVSEKYYNFINLEIVPSGWTWGSDHYNFWEAGYSAIFYSESNFNRYYHSPEDTIENMNISYTVKNSKLIIATLAELAEITDLQAPIKPIITKGLSNGKFGKEYNYSALTTDLQNDEIYYLWDWGDNIDSGWIGPYESGIECEISNIWEKRGNYIIKVKAKDANGYESKWSDPLSVSMPKYEQTKTIMQKLLLLLMKFEEKISYLKTNL